MSRDYIARDPRTGKPLNVKKSKSKKQYIEAQEGPWLAINEGAMPPQYLLDWQGPLAKTSVKISTKRTRDNSYWLAR